MGSFSAPRTTLIFLLLHPEAVLVYKAVGQKPSFTLMLPFFNPFTPLKRCKLPIRSRQSPASRSILMHFELKHFACTHVDSVKIFCSLQFEQARNFGIKNWRLWLSGLKMKGSALLVCSNLVIVIGDYNSCYVKVKRSLDDELDVIHSICPSESAWRALDNALDINNTAVRVYQPDNQDLTFPGRGKRHLQTPSQQWFYTVKCRNDAMAPLRACPGCCLAVDHSK